MNEGGIVPVGDDGLAVVLEANGWADAEDVTEARETLGDAADDAAVVAHLVEQGRMTGAQASDYEQISAHQGHLPNFRLLRKIGSGGMGVVYYAQHLATRRTCALKTINARLAEDLDTVNRFRREAETLSAISHANVAEVVDVGEINGHVYLAMQYIEGPSLGALLKDHGRIPELYALKIMRQVADGLSYVYSAAGLIHRDIKPENVLMQRSAGNEGVAFPLDDVAKLIDFGLVKSMDDRHLNLTQTGMTIGTPLYMSPEQVRGDPLDCRSDFYGISATLYHLVVGVPPYAAMSPGAIMSAHLTKPIPDPKEKLPGVHALTRTVIMTGMAKEFAERYRHYSDLIAAFDKAIAAVAERDGVTGAKPAAPDAEDSAEESPEERAEAAPAAEAAAGTGHHGADAHGAQGQAVQGHGQHAPPAGSESGRFRPQVKVDLPDIEHLATGSGIGPSPVKAAPAAPPAPVVAPPATGPKSAPSVPARPGRTTQLVVAPQSPGAQPTVRTARPAATMPDAVDLPTLTPPPSRTASAKAAAAPPVAANPGPARGELPQVGQPAAPAPDLSDAAAPAAPERRSRAMAPPGTGIGGGGGSGGGGGGGGMRGDLVITGTEDPGASASRVGASGGARVGASTANGRAATGPAGSATGTNGGTKVGATTASGRAIGGSSGAAPTAGAQAATGTNSGTRVGATTASGRTIGSTSAAAKAQATPQPPPAPAKPSDMIAVHALELELSQAKQTPQTSYLPWILLGVGVVLVIALVIFGLAG